MKRALPVALLIVAVLLGLQACGQNPLLRSVSADFAPIRVGSQWSYRTASGGSFTRLVASAGPAQGRQAFTVLESTDGNPPVTQLWSFQSGELDQYDAVNGWLLLRKLPYVTGNKWPLFSTDPLVTYLEEVEGFDTITVPAGKFDACYRVKTTISTYDPLADVTSTTQSLVWAAPNIGDVQTASVDVSGTQTVNLQLSSFRIPQ